jgi:hypothetical protein
MCLSLVERPLELLIFGPIVDISLIMSGKHHSEETKKKISESNKLTKKLNPPKPNSGSFTKNRTPWNKSI